MKYKTIQQLLDSQALTKEDMKEMILQSSLVMLMECGHNFGGNTRETERIGLTLSHFNEILDKVE